MTLARWLAAQRMTQADFAALIGVAPSVSHWVTGNAVPLPRTMAAIANATGGMVTAEDFRRWRRLRVE